MGFKPSLRPQAARVVWRDKTATERERVTLDPMDWLAPVSRVPFSRLTNISLFWTNRRKSCTPNPGLGNVVSASSTSIYSGRSLHEQASTPSLHSTSATQPLAHPCGATTPKAPSSASPSLHTLQNTDRARSRTPTLHSRRSSPHIPTTCTVDTPSCHTIGAIRTKAQKDKVQSNSAQLQAFRPDVTPYPRKPCLARKERPIPDPKMISVGPV